MTVSPARIASASSDRGLGSMSIVFFCQSCGSRFDVDAAGGGQGRSLQEVRPANDCAQGRTDRVHGLHPGPGRGGRRRRRGGVGGTWRFVAGGDDQQGRTGPAHHRSHAEGGQEVLGRRPRNGRRKALRNGEARTPHAGRASDPPGRRRRDGLARAARTGHEGLPQDQPGGLPHLGALPHAFAAGRQHQKPADGDRRGHGRRLAQSRCA